MSTRKPDRLERICTKLFFGNERTTRNSHVTYREVESLLRKEYRWVERMVEGEKVSGETGTEGDLAYNQACEDILAKLKERVR